MATVPTLNFKSIKLGNKEGSSDEHASFQQGFILNKYITQRIES